jgi:hypothetical protein
MNTQYLAEKYYLCSRQINRVSNMNLLNFVANFPDEASCKANRNKLLSFESIEI